MEQQNRQDLRVIARPHPFSAARIETRRPAGGTVAELMRSIDVAPDRIFARVFIDDRLVPSAEWETARPVAGQLLTVRVIPTGGGGGGGKDVLRLVAMIAVVAMAAWVSGGYAGAYLPEALGMAFGSGTTAAAVAGAVVGIAGSLAVNAHIPMPLPRRLPQPMPAPRLQVAA